VDLINGSSTRSVTHSYVLAELVALALVRWFPRPAVLAFVMDLLDTSDISTIWVDERLHRQATQLLIERPDKTYSLCDAVSFVLMRQRAITSALTTDDLRFSCGDATRTVGDYRHFEQAGFIRLLRPKA
jgi:uncharacterized protein